MSRPAVFSLGIFSLVLLFGTAASAAPPAEGECPSVAGAPLLEEGKGLVDAPPVLLKEGMVVEVDQLLMLRHLVPPVIWQHREVFFYEGMRMEIGACHARYPTFGPYAAATRLFQGKPRVDDEGNLENYTAGLPFPPETIDADDEQAGAKWAWNLEQRFRGAGFRGHFRITELPASIGGILTFDGTFFLVQTGHRSDLAESHYVQGGNDDRAWAAGGEFHEPFDARHLAWRQFRSLDALERWNEADDVFVYVPTMRKQRRGGTGWVDGLFVPNYTAGTQGSGGSMPYGDSGGGGGIAPTAGISIATSEDKGHGLTGITFRPNAYVWRVLGEQTVLAPLNANHPGFPQDDKRNYGTSGLSFASDRWDIRYAVIIEGALKKQDSDVRIVEIWVDYQTRQPLYWIARGSKRRLRDIGILVHRFSGDVAGYPEWPGGFGASVFDPVGAAFYDALAGGGGWRREAYDLRSIPFEPGELRSMTSADNLGKGK